MNTSKPVRNKDGRFFVETLPPRENSEKAYCPPSHGPDEYRGGFTLGGRMLCRDKRMSEAAAGSFILDFMKATAKISKEKSIISVRCLVWILIAVVLIATLLGGCGIAEVQASGSKVYTETSYFTYASCIKEGTSGIMANRKRLNDEEFICASWDYKLGTRLLVTSLKSGKVVEVTVTDRGPSKRLYRKGRKLDLSAAAFKAIVPDGLKAGVAMVTVERIGG